MLWILSCTRWRRSRVCPDGTFCIRGANKVGSIVHATIEQGFSICGIHPAIREEDHKFVSVKEIEKVTCPHCLKKYYKEG
jgi:hypothetical protein